MFDCRIKHTTQDNNVGFGVRVDIPYLLTVVGTCERTVRFLHLEKKTFVVLLIPDIKASWSIITKMVIKVSSLV